MTVSSTEVRWQNTRVHVPDYGSSRVAVKQHEDREGTREKDQDDKTSQSLSAKHIYMRRNNLICNVIKSRLVLLSLVVRCQQQQAPGAHALRSVRVSVRHGLLCHDRTPSRRQVFSESQRGQNSPSSRHTQNTSAWVKWIYCGSEALGNEQVNIIRVLFEDAGNLSEHLRKLINTHSCTVAAFV